MGKVDVYKLARDIENKRIYKKVSIFICLLIAVYWLSTIKLCNSTNSSQSSNINTAHEQAEVPAPIQSENLYTNENENNHITNNSDQAEVDESHKAHDNESNNEIKAGQTHIYSLSPEQIRQNQILNGIRVNPPTNYDLIINTRTSWYGTYSCQQGITNLHFEIIPNGDNFIGIFTFDYFNIRGKYILNGYYNKSTHFFQFFQKEWILQPVNYNMVDLEGFISDDGYVFSGNIKSQGCGNFYLTQSGFSQ